MDWPVLVMLVLVGWTIHSANQFWLLMLHALHVGNKKQRRKEKQQSTSLSQIRCAILEVKREGK